MIPIEKLRIRIGLTDTDASKDAELLAVVGQALSVIELYCDRAFGTGNEVETFTHVAGSTISLRRYPVTKINSLDHDTGRPISAYHLDKKAGLIQLDRFVVAHEITVNYEGGYNDLPPELELVVFSLFDKLWEAANGAGVPTTTGGIKAVKVGDLSVTYDTGAAASTAASNAGAFGGLIDPMSKALLDLYARQKA